MTFQQIGPEELRALCASGECTLVDVRTDAEVARGAIAGAKHIVLPTLPGHLGALPFDKPVVFYCQSGGRSAQACMWFASQGGTRVYNLQGGILAWARAGHELTNLL
jgi:rhodanese-related sulfurtransferase